jgi:hypothetical protein
MHAVYLALLEEGFTVDLSVLIQATDRDPDQFSTLTARYCASMDPNPWKAYSLILDLPDSMSMIFAFCRLIFSSDRKQATPVSLQ